jgi:hypothetical protein
MGFLWQLEAKSRKNMLDFCRWGYDQVQSMLSIPDFFIKVKSETTSASKPLLEERCGDL